MQLIGIGLFVLFACATAQRHFSRANNHLPNDQPITDVWADGSSDNLDINAPSSVKCVIARIVPGHIVPAGGRRDFRRDRATNTLFQRISVGDDERGHIVASQFSGPPEWYNLTPQSPKINRNEGTRHIIADWFNNERGVREYLEPNGALATDGRYVIWNVSMIYDNGDFRYRPTAYLLSVKNMTVDDRVFSEIYTSIPNPLPGITYQFGAGSG